MATLVLTVAGTILGGPVGGMIGATLGQAIDQRFLFAPKGRRGPQLSDLRVQTSSYGTRVPALFGTMRVAGTVIWATDLVERSHRHKTGKGQPKVTTYSYSVSFAVALSARRVIDVRRIWADGKLLRGAAGDFKSALGAFRLHDGAQDQPVDPLIGAATAGKTPAHRGIAYAVFEDLQLADFGNRIPSLTFEVVADEGAVPVARIAQVLGAGVFRADETGARIDGYAAQGGSAADAIGPLVEAFGLAVRDEAGALALSGDGGTADLIPMRASLRSANGKAVAGPRLSRRRVDQAPARLSIRHYDPARDYQASVQTALRPDTGPSNGGTDEAAIDLPAVLTAQAARVLAEQRVAVQGAGRERMELACGWSALALSEGGVAQVEGHGGHWQIDRWNWEDMQLRLSLRRIASGPVPVVTGSGGAGLATTDAPHGPTRLALIELPVLGESGADAPVVMAAAAGPETGWRAAALFARRGDGQLEPIGTSAPPAIMGSIATVPGPACTTLFDTGGWFDVTLLSSAMTLENATDAALAQGANLCVAGGELVQFGQAEPLGGGVWRLSRLLRGRRGTEHLAGVQQIGDPFVLIEEDRLFPVPAPWVEVGGATRIAAIGIGDAGAVEATLAVEGLAMMPLSPVHISAQVLGTGWRLGWTRRSRAGWRWSDGADAPLAEESERWRIDWAGAGGVFRTADTDSASFDYGSALADADRSAGHGGAVTISIRQMGTHGLGQAGLLTLML